MIRDKIIELESGINYYILEEITYNNKKYALAVECDLEKEEINEDKYIVMELKLENNNLITADIEDDKEAAIISKMLLEKARK